MPRKKKGSPITYRPDAADEQLLEDLVRATDLSPSDLSRRALKLYLEMVQKEGGISFELPTLPGEDPKKKEVEPAITSRVEIHPEFSPYFEAVEGDDDGEQEAQPDPEQEAQEKEAKELEPE